MLDILNFQAKQEKKISFKKFTDNHAGKKSSYKETIRYHFLFIHNPVYWYNHKGWYGLSLVVAKNRDCELS